MRLALALVLSLVACKTEAPGLSPSAPESAVAPKNPIPPSQDPPASEPAVAAAPPPTTAAPPPVSLDLTGPELLVLRTPHEHPWNALVRTPAAPAYTLCELVMSEPHAHLDLIRGEIQVTPLPQTFARNRCEVVRVDHRFTHDEHPIRPLTHAHLGELLLGFPPSEQFVPWPAKTDLATGPVRAIVGRESGVVVFASAYLGDLGTHFAVERRPLMTREELEADLAGKQGPGKRVGRLGGAHHFAPQVADARDRIAFSEKAVASVVIPSPQHVDYGPFAVALRVGDETRYLMLQSYTMTDSWTHAFRRGRVIERIVEDGARP